MNFNLPDIMDFAFKLLASIAVIVAILQLIEVKRKRMIEMYWKISEIYSSDIQRTARKHISKIQKVFEEKLSSGKTDKDLMDFYSSIYHLTENEENKNIDTSILDRIRFINQLGILLKRNLIDKDMLFTLIGARLDIDYPIIKLILETHRRDHHALKMYSEFETVWTKFKKWQR